MPRDTDFDYPIPPTNFACRFDLWLNLHVMPPRQKLLLWFVVALEGLASGQSQPREVPDPAPFLMRWHFTHILGGGFPELTVEDTCIVVYPSGLLRMEKSTQRKGDRLRMQAFENSLSENDLQQLQQLLDDPMLKASTHQRFATRRNPREGELTALAIPRDGRIQHLNFASYFGYNTKYIGADLDPDESLVRPLQKWLKSHIEARKLEALPVASATRCVAPPDAEHP
jgi:hypothetical protein